LFKNIDKYGLERKVDGNLGFTYRVVSSPLNKKPEAVVANALGSQFKNKDEDANVTAVKQSLAGSSVSENKKSQLSGPSSKRHKITASGNPAFGGIGNMNNMAGSSVGSLTPYYRILEGIINEDDWTTKRLLYRDIYSYDLAGAVVDLFANLPFSDFNLTGIEDKGILNTYREAIADLPLRTMLPAITVDYLVNGAFLGSLDYRDSKFKYLFPFNLDDATIQNLGLFIGDPIVDITLPRQMQSVLSITGDPRVDALKAKLPDYIKNTDKSNKIQLDPETTMYIPRGGMSTANMGSSFFNRILTIHLVEKALIKGTIESAQRRQRAIMHIQAGIDGVWEPSNEELTQIANLVLAADLDPISGIVVTRNGVQFSDIKAGADFWNWTEIFDFATTAKLECLGVNEGILKGDSSFNTLEAALSSFMDNVNTTRDVITNKVFEDKLFKIVAKDNGFYKTEKEQEQGNSVLSSTQKVEYINPLTVTAAKTDDDGREYNMPSILWERQLKPRADTDYLQILETLESKGIPIPLRLYAAAGGENIDELIGAMDSDAELQIQIADNKKKLIQEAKKEKVEKFLNIENIDMYDEDEGGMDFGMDRGGMDYMSDMGNESEPEPMSEEPSEDVGETASSLNKTINHGVLSNANKARHITELDNLYGPRVRDSEGRRRPMTAEMKKHIEEKANQQINTALKNLSKKGGL